MKIQVLKVRIHKDFLEQDQKTVNDFVANHEVVSVDTAFVQEEYYWSVILYYKDLLCANTPQKTLLNERVATKNILWKMTFFHLMKLQSWNL